MTTEDITAMLSSVEGRQILLVVGEAHFIDDSFMNAISTIHTPERKAYCTAMLSVIPSLRDYGSTGSEGVRDALV